MIHQAIVRQLSNQRLGTHATKDKKFCARRGKETVETEGNRPCQSRSIRSPLWVGGGTVFGPQPRSYVKGMPRKARRLAVRSALSEKLCTEEFTVIDQIQLAAPKTKEIVKFLGAFQATPGKALIISDADPAVLERCARNIPGVKAMAPSGLNIYDIVHYTKLFVTKAP